MARMTKQDEAMLAPVDRFIGGGSNLVGYARTMLERQETETSYRIGHRLTVPLELLAGIRDEFSWEDHDQEHEAVAPAEVEQCVACRLQQVVDLVMEAPVL